MSIICHVMPLQKFLLPILALSLIKFCVQVNARTNCNPRDTTKLEPERKCKKACQSDADCSGALKKCHCDGLCGLSCFNKDLNCTQLNTTIPNGDVTVPSLKYGSIASYKCKSGYVGLNGSTERKCRSDKMWSGSELVCKRGCGTISRIGRAYPNPIDYRESNLDGYAVDYVMPYACDNGYLMTGNHSRTCLPTFQWSPATFSCTIKKCPPLSVSTPLDFTGDNTYASTVTFTCNKGYNLVGKSTDLCTENYEGNMVWENPKLPTCEVVRCSAPTKPANGDFIDAGVRFVYGSKITYTCNQGYLFAANSPTQGTCNENGTWGALPVCETTYDCNFEKFATSYCTYTRQGWTREQMTDHTGTKRRYGLRAYGSARLTSFLFPASNYSHLIVFYYTTSASSVSLQLYSADNSLLKILWTSAQNQGTWKKVEVLLNAMPENVTWSFVNQGGSSKLDDITLEQTTVTTTVPVSTTTTATTTKPPAVVTTSTQATKEPASTSTTVATPSSTPGPVTIVTTSTAPLTTTKAGRAIPSTSKPVTGTASTTLVTDITQSTSFKASRPTTEPNVSPPSAPITTTTIQITTTSIKGRIGGGNTVNTPAGRQNNVGKFIGIAFAAFVVIVALSVAVWLIVKKLKEKKVPNPLPNETKPMML